MVDSTGVMAVFTAFYVFAFLIAGSTMFAAEDTEAVEFVTSPETMGTYEDEKMLLVQNGSEKWLEIHMGRRATGGFDVLVNNISLGEDRAEIQMDYMKPGETVAVPQVITYPSKKIVFMEEVNLSSEMTVSADISYKTYEENGTVTETSSETRRFDLELVQR